MRPGGLDTIGETGPAIQPPDGRIFDPYWNIAFYWGGPFISRPYMARGTMKSPLVLYSSATIKSSPWGPAYVASAAATTDAMGVTLPGGTLNATYAADGNSPFTFSPRNAYDDLGTAIPEIPGPQQAGSLICTVVPAILATGDSNTRAFAYFGTITQEMLLGLSLFAQNLHLGWVGGSGGAGDDRVVILGANTWPNERLGTPVTLGACYKNSWSSGTNNFSVNVTKTNGYVMGVNGGTTTSTSYHNLIANTSAGVGTNRSDAAVSKYVFGVGGDADFSNSFGCEWPILNVALSDRQFTDAEMAYIDANPLNWAFMPGAISSDWKLNPPSGSMPKTFFTMPGAGLLAPVGAGVWAARKLNENKIVTRRRLLRWFE